ncbi:MAG: hypothetical protein M1598_02945 [Actinobacteria bacterium]|nr:hypothetical protein [Actinomycetota bacterium]
MIAADFAGPDAAANFTSPAAATARRRSVGIAGTAKNTGKTTTLTAIVEEAHGRGTPLGLTSIGYDGEAWDNITGLPKPRVHCPEGTIVATAERCLEAGTAELAKLEDSGIRTPLGRVFITRVTKPGLVVLAGPNKTAELAQVVGQMDLNPKMMILVDGALNRLAPMVAAGGLILATGAARQPDIGILARETRAIGGIFGLASDLAGPASGEVTLTTPAGDHAGLGFDSLLVEESAKAIAAAAKDRLRLGDRWRLEIPGAMAGRAFAWLALALGEAVRGLTVVAGDPTKLLVAGDPEQTWADIERLGASGGEVMVTRNLPLYAVTVNPFYPSYDHQKNVYTEAFVDRERLVRAVGEVVPRPVLDVKRDGGGKLLDILLKESGFKTPGNQAPV